MSLISQPMPEISGVSKFTPTAGHPVDLTFRSMDDNMSVRGTGVVPFLGIFCKIEFIKG